MRWKHVVGRQEFAGYWEYVLDDAIFTAPVYPPGVWRLIGNDGKLMGWSPIRRVMAWESATRHAAIALT